MARVTVQDCITNVPNRFKLVIMAGQRARELSSGAKPTVAKGNDKNPVVALREIAAKSISLEELEEKVVHNFQYYVPAEENDEDVEEDTDNEAMWSMQMAELEREMGALDDEDEDDDDLDPSFENEDK
jgi:DNA-directed RNA polymerase subunit omega